MSDLSPYRMTLSLGVIDHLGLNLYSNIPAVVSELVANAWDADAETVSITIDTGAQEIEIRDDGHGMTREDINQKFLMVGYRRREHEPAVTQRFNRHVMGRKGIGKLSIFSIAEEVEVHSATRSDGGDPFRSGFVMRTADIRHAIEEGGGEYHPEAVEEAAITLQKGTMLVLRKLRRKATARTGNALRKRLARRFSIIGEGHNFEVQIDGSPVGVADRDYFGQLEYLWSVGDVGSEFVEQATNAKQTEHLGGVIDEAAGFEVTGWIGTVKSHSSLDEGDNSVVVLAWGKLIHEDVLKDIKAGGLYTKYLIGELRADFLDSDQEPDIVTSDRQSLREDDARFVVFRDWVKDSVLREIGNRWRDWRRAQAMEEARSNEVVNEWYETLGSTSKEFAKTLFGKIGGFPVEKEGDRNELYKHTILAFERLKFRDSLRKIEQLGDHVDMSALQALFATIDDLEAAEYHRIAQGRLEVIRRFEDLADADAKERVIQEHLFDHLWLLHPSWERASKDTRLERTVSGIFEEIADDLTEEEKGGRIDIAFRTAANKNVIIELKRYSRRVDVFELASQLSKYRTAVEKCVRESFPEEERAIEVIAVLGEPPSGEDQERAKALLEKIGARWITYDTLIEESLRSYEDYLDAHRRTSRIIELLERLDSSDESDTQ